MIVTISIETNGHDLAKQLRDFADGIQPQAKTEYITFPEVLGRAAADPKVIDLETEKKKRGPGRPAKEATISNPPPVITKQADMFVDDAPTTTFEQMKAALQGVLQLRPKDAGNAGTVRVQEILKKYDCKNPMGQPKISLVKPQDFAAIVADCLALEGKTA